MQLSKLILFLVGLTIVAIKIAQAEEPVEIGNGLLAAEITTIALPTPALAPIPVPKPGSR